MRARTQLRDLLAEYDQRRADGEDPLSDDVDFADQLLAVNRAVIAEFDELYDVNGDQVWGIWEDEVDGTGNVYLERNDGNGATLLFVETHDPFAEHGPAYQILRAIYGGEPDKGTGR